ncbi:beta-lactamase family protein [Pseudoflavitalea sp. G-6-1-2]|uniref:serine hydrolase domain-containing protein n=1 Tax=Pseudoflavitalea sp. G-6-1-2 TaxID=2728841 RepID=UPI00146E5356|nr:serine hydrolase domain-containing protein [Pseudoflavitalea sp. G-6-1-2]NML22897.1 beta-lactamase family protein [Pseudoflavitalea sp. G-6-1-2]
MKAIKLTVLFLAPFLYATAQTKSTGFDPERLKRIDRFFENEIKEKHIPGGTVLLIKKGEVVYNKAYGYADIESKRKMKTDDIFRIASQTKAVTSVAAMMLWEEGKFLLDDPISKYIPAFKSPQVLVSFNPKDSSYTTRPAKREITIRHLLSHTSGLIYNLPYMGDPELTAIYHKAGIAGILGKASSTAGAQIPQLAKLPLLHDPGEFFTYSISTDVIGYLVELLSGQDLETFFRERIFIPLDMSDTWFNLPADKVHRLISIYQPTQNGELIKADRVFDQSPANYPAVARTNFSGGGGLSSTTADFAKFLQMMLNKGKYKGKRLLSPSTVELMLTNQLSDSTRPSKYSSKPESYQFGLGFALETEKNDFLLPVNKGTFNWAGAFATYYFVDPKEELIALYYTQEYLPALWNYYEEMTKIITYQALSD